MARQKSWSVRFAGDNQLSLFDYMEVFYNRQRRRSTIKYVAPLAFDESASA
jgi:hypothetical protein